MFIKEGPGFTKVAEDCDGHPVHVMQISLPSRLAVSHELKRDDETS